MTIYLILSFDIEPLVEMETAASHGPDIPPVFESS